MLGGGDAPHGRQVEEMIADALDMQDQHVRDLRDVFVVRRVDDQFVEAGVVSDDRGGVALDVGLGRGLQLLLQLLEHGVGQIPAGELRGQRVDLRQRPVAFFEVLHIEIRDHGRAAGDHTDQLLVLQQLERLPHGRAADVEVGGQLRIQDLLAGLHDAGDDPVADRLINNTFCRLALQRLRAFRDGHASASCQFLF